MPRHIPILGQDRGEGIAGPRPCGECTLCCKLLGVPELGKPPGTYCTHAKKAQGCQIYTIRPNQCRNFECAWALGYLPLWARPDKIHGVMVPTSHEEGLALHEDPGYPGEAFNRLSGILNLLLRAGITLFRVRGERIETIHLAPEEGETEP